MKLRMDLTPFPRLRYFYSFISFIVPGKNKALGFYFTTNIQIRAQKSGYTKCQMCDVDILLPLSELQSADLSKTSSHGCWEVKCGVIVKCSAQG